MGTFLEIFLMRILNRKRKSSIEMCFNTFSIYLRCVYQLTNYLVTKQSSNSKHQTVCPLRLHCSSNAMKSVFKTLPLTIVLVLAINSVDSASLVGGETRKWSEWKTMHKKSYSDAYEENFRHAIWRYNLKV